MTESIKLSKHSDDFITSLSKYGYKREELVPVAFAVGLRDAEALPEKLDSAGPEIPISVIYRKNLGILYENLIKYKFGLDTVAPDTVKRLTDYGFRKMKEIYDLDESPDFLLRLVEEITSYEDFLAFRDVDKIVLTLGQDMRSGETITYHWNDFKINQHMAIIGMSGSGKTYLALKLLSQIVEQSKNTGLMIFDYAKGDIIDNIAVECEVYEVGTDIFPYNPFELPKGVKIEDFADSIVDIIKSIYRGIGTVQALKLREVLIELYNQTPKVDASMILQALKRKYKEEKRKDDSLIEVFVKSSSLFPKSKDSRPFEELLSGRVVVGMHKVMSEDNKKFFLLVLLNRFHRLIMSQKDSIVVDESRFIRNVVFIDEVHQFLKLKNNPIARLLREVRSKGVALILASQQIDDFEQDESYIENIQTVILMRSRIGKISALLKLLNVNQERARSLVEEIQDFDVGEFVTRIGGELKFVKFNL
ncbi:ATP-binding protein [Archaeoglobus sp.]